MHVLAIISMHVFRLKYLVYNTTWYNKNVEIHNQHYHELTIFSETVKRIAKSIVMNEINKSPSGNWAKIKPIKIDNDEVTFIYTEDQGKKGKTIKFNLNDPRIKDLKLNDQVHVNNIKSFVNNMRSVINITEATIKIKNLLNQNNSHEGFESFFSEEIDENAMSVVADDINEILLESEQKSVTYTAIVTEVRLLCTYKLLELITLSLSNRATDFHFENISEKLRRHIITMISNESYDDLMTLGEHIAHHTQQQSAMFEKKSSNNAIDDRFL